MKGIGALKRERDSLGTNFDQMCVKYFDIAHRYCLNKHEYEQMVQQFELLLQVDIHRLTEELSPLGVKQTWKLDNERPEGWEEKAMAALEGD